MYKKGEDVEFYDKDRWVAAVVSDLEQKAVSETDRRQITHYVLKLKDNNNVIKYALDNELRMPSLYKVEDEVDFYDQDAGGVWVPAHVIRVTYKALSDSNHLQVPHYNLALTDSNEEVEDALAGDLQTGAQFRVDDEVEFYQKSVGAGLWAAAVIINVTRSETGGLRVPRYDLILTSSEETVRNVLSDRLRYGISTLIDPDYQEGERVDFYHDDPGYEQWVEAIITKAQYKEVSKNDHRLVPCYDLEVLETGSIFHDALGNTLRPDIRPLLDPVYLEGDEVIFHGEDDGEIVWLDAVVTQVEYKSISDTDPRQVPCYGLELLSSGDYVENAFGSLLRRNVKGTRARDAHVSREPARRTISKATPLVHSPAPMSTPHKQLRVIKKTPSQLVFDEEFNEEYSHDTDLNEDVFILGDRVEIHCDNMWEPGMVLHVTESDTGAVVYSVRYDDMSSESGVEQSRVQGLFTEVGLQVSVHNSQGDSKWGIVVGCEPLGKTSETGSHMYQVLTQLEAPHEVVRCEPKDLTPFRHIFEEHEVVEVMIPDHDDEPDVMSWQRATVEHVDKDTMHYTLSIGADLWTNIEGGAIRPLFMVGNFVRVLQHRITVSGFKGEPEWVKGVVTSINKVPYMTEAALEAEGHLYQYSVLRLDSNTDEERDVELDVITVNMPDLMVKWHQHFSQHEDVEVQMHSGSGDEHILQCTNGKIVRALETNRIFDVALTTDTSSSAGSVMKGVPNQALRKRFLCGEIVECYLDQVGWSPGYVLRQLPNAITVPDLNSKSEAGPMSASMYDLFCCVKKGGMHGFHHEPLQCSISIYKVFVHNTNGDLLSQTMRVRSHHIRKLLGHPSEQIFTNVDEMIAARKAAKHQFWKKKQKQQPSAVSAEDGASSDSASSGDTARKMLQTQLSREDQEEEIVNFLDDFRANLMEGDDVEVAVIEGVPSRKNSFRRAICARVPGKNGAVGQSVDVKYLDGEFEKGIQQTRLFPGRFHDPKEDKNTKTVSPVRSDATAALDAAAKAHIPGASSVDINSLQTDIKDAAVKESKEQISTDVNSLQTDKKDPAVKESKEQVNAVVLPITEDDSFLIKQGMRVQARIRGEETECEGTVIACDPMNGVADVLCKNRHMEFNLPFSCIRKASSPTKILASTQKLQSDSDPKIGLDVALYPKHSQAGHVNFVRKLRNDINAVFSETFSIDNQQGPSLALVSPPLHSSEQTDNEVFNFSSPFNSSGGSGLISSPERISPTTPNESSAAKMHRMGQLAEREGNPERAAILFHEAFVMYQRAHGERNNSSMLSLSCYARALAAAKDYEKAKKAHEQVIRIKKEVLGNAHISTAMSLAELGIVHYRQGDNSGAVLELRRSLRSGDLAGKAQHVIMSMPLVFLGNALLRSGPEWAKEAWRYHHRCIIYVQQHSTSGAMTTELLDRSHMLKVCDGLMDAVQLLSERNEYDQTIKLLRAVHQLQLKYMGAIHPDLSDTVQKIHEITQKKQQIDAEQKHD